MIDVSVILETVTLRYDHDHGPLADAIAPTLAALERQTVPRDRFEVLIVLDDAIDAETVAELQRRHPSARLVHGAAPNYFAEKNAGVAAARGAKVVFLDGDCIPDPAWLEVLLAGFAQGVDVVTGRTRYEGNSLAARTFSVPDFGTVFDQGGVSSGIMLNNVIFPRELALQYPLDARIPRNGGCYLLYHQLRAVGRRVVYEPRAIVSHGVDVDGLGFVRKHFDRGYDTVAVYRCDDQAVLRGTRLFRRLGPVALAAITARRILTDWRRLARERAQVGISLAALPYHAAVTVVTRGIELAGGVVATVRKR
jgi:glycosyltransferase involved in cell wall biosynthesis